MTFRIMSLLIVPLIFYSCTSHRTIEANNLNIQFHIKPGDKVRVQTKDNQKTEFVVTEVNDEAILGQNQKVLFTDIEKLQKQTVSAGENFGLITLTTIGAAAGVLSAASTFTVCCW